MAVGMTQNKEIQKDTAAWKFQVWAAFTLAIAGSLIGIGYLPLEPWTRAFIAMGYVFTLASSFTLAKTLRDNHEASKLINRIVDAKAERLLREYEFNLDQAQRAPKATTSEDL